MPPLARLLLAGALALAATVPAAAQGPYYDLERWTDAATSVRPGVPKPWRLNLGLGAGAAPLYRGSDEYEPKILPLAELEYRDLFFVSTRKGIGVSLLRKREVRAGLRAQIDLGRDSADSDTLAGLPDIDPGLEVGAFLEYYTTAWRVRAHMAQEVLDGHGGFLAGLDVAYGGRWSRHASLILGGEITAMSDQYAESYFGVAADDAAPDRPAFAAGAGLRDIGVYGQVIYDISQAFYVSLEARANLLMMDAADSPLTDSDLQFFGGAMVGYRF